MGQHALNMHRECALIFSHNLSHILCLKNVGLYYICTTLLVIKAIILEVIEILETFVKGQPSGPLKFLKKF